MPGEPIPAKSLNFHEAEFQDGQTFRAHVFGRRAASVAWVPNASLNGVAVDSDLAVNEQPSRTLEVGEIPNPDKPSVTVCPVSGKATGGGGLEPGEAITTETPAVETATQIVHFCGSIHIDLFNGTLIMGEGVSGGAAGFTGILPAAPTPALGVVRVLAIPMTYADQNSVPANEATLYATLRDVSDFYSKASFGRLTLVGVVTPPIKLPHDEAWYTNRDTSNGGDISGTSVEHSDARNEARKLGFDSNDYDCTVVRHNGGPQSYGGLGGGSSVWVRTDGAGTWAHEIGHCFTLAHSNFWDTAGTSAIGAGTNAEYGDQYDIMGSGAFPAGHYNAQAKNQIKWLPNNFVQSISQSGTYRLHAFDAGSLLPDRRYAFTIVKDAQRTYWAEVRSLFDTYPWVKQGVLLGWRYPNGAGSNLQRIDVTPGSPYAKDDAAIALGNTFSDTEAGIHITTIAVNDSPRYADVVVNFGQFPTNHPPTLSLSASADVVPTNATVTFTATATDPDGDTLAYYWEHFGDTSVRLVSGNTPTITRTFTTAGTYVVTCHVSDMKGGRSTASKLITVGNGNTRYNISGRITYLGAGLPDVVVTANGANGVVTDADGNYTIPNLAANTYTMLPLLYGYSFGELFNNSVTVGPNATGANFEATLEPTVTITASVPQANEGTLTPGQFTIYRTGDISQPLVVNVGTAVGTAAKTSDYTFTPDYVTGSQGFSTFNIPADAASLDVVVTPVADTLVEGPETVILQLGPATGYLVGAQSSATVTIIDDDTALPTVSVAATVDNVMENGGPVNAFSFSRTSTAGDLVASYSVSGTAVAGSDYTALSGTVTIPNGSTSATVVLSPIDDTVSEPLETVKLSIATTAAYLADPLASSATVNLIDDDVQTVTLVATDPNAKEVDLSQPGAVADTGTFVVTRTGDTSKALTVYYAISGTPSAGVAALQGIDFEALPGSVVIPAGASQASITIVPRYDTIGEGPEQVVMSLGAGSTNYVLGTPSSAIVTITDAADNVPYVDVVGLTTAAEPSTNGVFRFGIRGNTAPFAIHYTIGGTATNGVDYDSGTVWAPQSSGVSNALAGVWVLNATNVWAVGDTGTILKWNGAAWSAQTSGATAALNAVWGVDASNVWAVGDGGTILKWNGTAWAAQTSGTTSSLRAIWGSAATSVWAVGDGGTILKWNGTAWSAQTSGVGTGLYGIWGSSATSLWAVGASGVILKGTGTAWSPQTSNSPETLRGVWGSSATSLWAVGTSGAILRSTNGTSWTGQTSNTANDLNAIWGSDSSNLWAVSDAGAILRTTNGGTTWTQLVSNTLQPLKSVRGVDANNVWAVGAAGTIQNWNSTASLPLSGTVVVPAGQTTLDLTLRTINDALVEDLESITLSITPDAAYTTFGPTSAASIWLRDDDQPTVFVDTQVGTSGSLTIQEGATTTPVKFYVSRTGSTTNALTVNYTTGGTATSGVDYTALSGSVVILAGSPGADIPVTITNDTLFEGVETITLDLAPGAYARGPSAVMYISDNDTATNTVQFQATSSSGLESATTVTIPVTLASVASTPVSVEYAVSGSTSGTSSTATYTHTLPYWVRVSRNGAAITYFESNDGITWTQRGAAVTLPNLTTGTYYAGLAVASGSGTSTAATIDNFAITDVAAGGSVGATNAVNLGNATGGTHTLSSGVYTFNTPGNGIAASSTADNCRFVFFPVTNSSTCTVTARVVSLGSTASAARAVVMLRQDVSSQGAIYAAAMAGGSTTAPPFISGSRATLNASSSTQTPLTSPVLPMWFRLVRAGNAFTTSYGRDGTNWSAVGSSQTIALGSPVLAGLAVSSRSDGVLSTATFDNVSITPVPSGSLAGREVGFVNIDGSDSQSSGVWTVNGSGAGITTGTDEARFVATDVTGDFTLVARLTSLFGGASNAQAGVMMRQDRTQYSREVYAGFINSNSIEQQARTQSVTTAFGSGIDFSCPPGVLNFAIGEQTKNITFTVVNDNVREPNQLVTLQLSNAVGANLGTNIYHGYTIIDDDGAAALPFAGFASATSTAAESAGSASIPVSLSAPASGAMSVDYAVTGGTATAGADFNLTAGTLTFAAGETVRTIPLTILDDTTIEPNETVVVTLSNPVGVQLGSLATHTLTILDDDLPSVNISATDPNAAESGDPGTFTITRTGPTTSALTVNFTVGGTATNGTDYTLIASPGTLVLPAGATSGTITVSPLQDTLSEGNETVVVSLATGSGYGLGAQTSATVTIADDDRNTVSITANVPNASETGPQQGQFTVTRTGPTTAALTVNLTVSGTATSGSDYTTNPATITTLAFAAGQSSRTIDIIPIDDSITEGPEDITISIAAGSYDIGTSSFDNVTIADNDSPPTLFISSPTAQGPLIATGNGVIVSATVTDDGAPQPVALQWTQAAGPGVATFESPTSATTAVTFDQPGTYVLRITATDGQFTVSDQVTVVVGTGIVAANWITQDLGPSSARRGQGLQTGNLFSVSGTGAGYASTTADQAHVMVRTVDGDTSIVARLTSLPTTGALAGVTIRDAMLRSARRAVFGYVPGTGLQFRTRLTVSTNDTVVSQAGVTLPLWVKLDRNSTTGEITASYSADSNGQPAAWTALGTPTVVTMDARAEVGLTATSNSTSSTATALFDHVTLTPTPSGPAFLSEDGALTPASAGSESLASGTYTVAASSSGYFHGWQFFGDVMITAKHATATSGAGSATSGIRISENIESGGYSHVGRIPQGAYNGYYWRSIAGGGNGGVPSFTGATRWIRLIRQGNAITAFHAPDVSGSPGTWTQLGQPRSVIMTTPVFIGFWVDNVSGVGLNTVTFTNLSIVPLNSAPAISIASPGANVTSPLTLDGTVTDDNFPAPANVKSHWSVRTGAGFVALGTPDLPDTSVTLAAAGNYTLRLQADDGSVQTFSDVSFTGYLNAYDAWRGQYFGGLSSLSNPKAAQDADPDADGLSNFAEFSLGTNPNAANTSPTAIDKVTIGQQQFLRMSVPRNTQASGVQYVVEGGNSLTSPDWSTTGLTVEVNTSSLLRVRDNVPIGSTPQRYLRLRLVQP